jgi:hypothetical protein
VILYTARLPCRDAAAVDITRQGNDRLRHAGKPTPGLAFAPSWQILKPALAAIRGRGELATPEQRERAEVAWVLYVAQYTSEMRHSYRTQRAAWDHCLSQPRLVFCCYCPVPTNGEPLRCHRVILAPMFVACGAEYRGELT